MHSSGTTRPGSGVATLLVPLATLLLCGCSGKMMDPSLTASTAVSSISSPPKPPAPVSPEAAVQYLAWCFNHRDWRRYAEILTDDYRFIFAEADSAGTAFRSTGGLLGPMEIEIARHLFETGTQYVPPASRVTLSLGPLTSLPDPRPGKNSTVHRMVYANLNLSIETPDASFRVTGAARFFAARGDSAQIPVELRSRGFGPDPARWWIERWEDETLGTPSAPPDAAMPMRQKTFGSIKALYL